MKQPGFASLLTIVLIFIIFAATATIVKNGILTGSQPTADKGFEGSSSAVIKASPSPKISRSTVKVAAKISPTNLPATTPAPASPASPAPTATSTPNPTVTTTAAVTVTYPNGGETVDWNSPLTIRWNTANLSKVAIRLNRNGSHLVDINPYTDNTGSYSWIPSSQIANSIAGAGFRISITGYTQSGAEAGTDLSDNDFTINAQSTATTGTLSGSVKDSSGNLVAYSNVEIYCSCNDLVNHLYSGGSNKYVFTDSSGSFTVLNLNPNTYTLYYLQGGATRTGNPVSVTIIAGQTSNTTVIKP